MSRIEIINDHLKEDPNDSFLRFALAQEFTKENMIHKAIVLYRQLIIDDPGYIGTYYHLGKLLEETEEVDEAIKIYLQGINEAKKIQDWHSISELNGAKTNIEMGLI